MPIDFPSSPTTGQVYTYLGKSWVYNGTGWDAPRADIIEYLPSLVGGNTFSGVQTFTTPIAVPSGGTGAATLTSGGYLKGAGTSAITSQSGIPAGDITSGTLGIARGGTGATTLTSGAYLKGAGTSAITAQAGIPAGDITSGQVNFARMPAGSVLQITQGYSTAVVQSTSTTFVDTTLQATITPRSASSDIFILVSQNGIYKTSNNTQSSTDLRVLFPGGGNFTWAIQQGWTNTATDSISSSSISIVTSAGSTSTQTFKTQFRNNVNASSIFINQGAVSSMILIEVAK
jgi:hypothetical protein